MTEDARGRCRREEETGVRIGEGGDNDYLVTACQVIAGKGGEEKNENRRKEERRGEWKRRGETRGRQEG